MTIHLWSSLSDAAVLAYDPASDVLHFDAPGGGGYVSAAGIQFDPERPAESVFTLDGKTVTLQTSPRTLTTTNVVFDGGSVLVGDNTIGAVDDDGPNTLGAAGPIAPPMGSFLAGLGGEDTLNGWYGADVMYGGAANDTLNGWYGSDLLDGGAGDDLMRGGPGDDCYWVDSPGDQVFELPYDTTISASMAIAYIGTGGIDAVRAGMTFTLPANAEILYLLGTGDFTGGGNASGNSIFGNAGANFIAGEEGNDRLWGGEGADQLSGGEGVDLLSGDAGGDQIDGGPGVDLAAYDSATAGVRVDLNAAQQDTGGAGIDTLIGIEYLLGSLFADTLIGDAGANVLTGNGGADGIQGGAGDDWIEGDSSAFNGIFSGVATADVIDGGAGNDTILGDAGEDRIFGGAGVDLIVGEAGDDLVYGGTETDYIDGRGGSDQLFGEDGADVIFGDEFLESYGFSSDAIHGGAGDDTIMGESGDHRMPGALDMLYGEDGADLIFGGGGDDLIYAGDGADVVDGGIGSDLIVAGPGADILLGSGASAYAAATAGNDLFVFTQPADAGDRIWGFDTRAGDMDGIDLRALLDALGYAGTNPRADGWLTVTGSFTPQDSVVWIDPNGSADSFTPFITLYGVAPATLTDDFFLFR